MKRIEKMQENERRLKGKTIIGIDPAKSKHHALVITPEGATAGKSFSFPVSHRGFTETLPQRLDQRTLEQTDLVFAIETSCARWQTLAGHLHEQGQEVVLVSPLLTHHARASLTRDFSRTDPKDAHLIAKLARQSELTAVPCPPPVWSSSGSPSSFTMS